MQSSSTNASDLDFDFPLDDLNLPDPSLCQTLHLFDAGPSEPSTICDEEDGEEESKESKVEHSSRNLITSSYPSEDVSVLKKELQHMHRGLRHAAVVLESLQTTQNEMRALRRRLIGVELENRRLQANLKGRVCCLQGGGLAFGEWLDRVVEGEGEYGVWCHLCGRGGVGEFLSGLPTDLGEVVTRRAAEVVFQKLMEGKGLDRLLAILSGGGRFGEDVLRLLREVEGDGRALATEIMVRGVLSGAWSAEPQVICLARLIVDEGLKGNVSEIIDLVKEFPRDNIAVRILVPTIQDVRRRCCEEGEDCLVREGVLRRCRAVLELYLEGGCDKSIEECVLLAYELESRFCGTEVCFDTILNGVLWSQLSNCLSNLEFFAKVLRLVGSVAALLVEHSDVVVRRGLECVIERLARVFVLRELPSQMRAGAISAVVNIAMAGEGEFVHGVVEALKEWRVMDFAQCDAALLPRQVAQFLREWKLEHMPLES